MSLFMESVFSTRFWILSHLCHPRKLTCLYKKFSFKWACSVRSWHDTRDLFFSCLHCRLLIIREKWKTNQKNISNSIFFPSRCHIGNSVITKNDPVMNTNDIASILEQYLRFCSPLLLAFVETFASHNHWNHLYYSRNNRLLDGLCRPWWSGA